MGRNEIDFIRWQPPFPCGPDGDFQACTIDDRHQFIVGESAQTQERKVSSVDVFIGPDDNALIQIKAKGSSVRALHQSALQIRMQPDIGLMCFQSLALKARSAQHSQEFGLNTGPANYAALANKEIMIVADIKDRREDLKAPSLPR
jgi:hypothetical protein